MQSLNIDIILIYLTSISSVLLGICVNLRNNANRRLAEIDNGITLGGYDKQLLRTKRRSLLAGLIFITTSLLSMMSLLTIYVGFVALTNSFMIILQYILIVLFIAGLGILGTTLITAELDWSGPRSLITSIIQAEFSRFHRPETEPMKNNNNTEDDTEN